MTLATAARLAAVIFQTLRKHGPINVKYNQKMMREILNDLIKLISQVKVKTVYKQLMESNKFSEGVETDDLNGNIIAKYLKLPRISHCVQSPIKRSLNRQIGPA